MLRARQVHVRIVRPQILCSAADACVLQSVREVCALTSIPWDALLICCVRGTLAAAVQNILDDVEGKPCSIDCTADGTCSFNIQVRPSASVIRLDADLCSWVPC